MLHHSLPTVELFLFSPFNQSADGDVAPKTYSQSGESDSEATQRTSFGGFVIFVPPPPAFHHDEPAVDRNLPSLSSSTNASVIKCQRDLLCSDSSPKPLKCFT